MRLLLCILLLAGSVFAQDGNRIHRHKHYDTTVVEDYQKVRRRRLTTDVDSTGIAIYAWGDECYFKVKLRNHDDNINHYETGTYNGHPYVKYGNNKYRYRMYMTEHGAFEFDAIIRQKSVSGRYFFPFAIQSQGLNFHYQDSLTQDEIDDGSFRADSVVGSYAVYHKTKRGNKRTITGTDTTYDNYMVGKAFHIYRPKAWDDAGDTVWGFIEIDTVLGRMKIGADSIWMANATYPVTIDPTFGTEAGGGTNFLVNVNQIRHAKYTMGSPGGTVDSISAYINDDGNTSLVGAAIYDDNAGTCNTLVDSSTIQETTAPNTTAWIHFTSAETPELSASTDYWLSFGASSVCNFRYDDLSSGESEGYFADGWPFESTCQDNWTNNDYTYSIFGSYTIGGAGDAYEGQIIRTVIQ